MHDALGWTGWRVAEPGPDADHTLGMPECPNKVTGDDAAFNLPADGDDARTHRHVNGVRVKGEIAHDDVLGTGPSLSGALAFSRDGKLLAASRPDGSVLVLDPATGRVQHTLHPLSADETVSLGPVTSIAVDPTGQRFATTGGQDGTVKLWSSSTLEQEGTAFSTEQGATTAAAFEPGGKSLLVVDDHGNGFTWPTSLAAWERRACTIAGRNLTRAEWARYLPGHPYTQVCP